MHQVYPPPVQECTLLTPGTPCLLRWRGRGSQAGLHAAAHPTDHSMSHDTALLVIDMQERFRGGGLAESILSELNLTIDACRALGLPIVFTLHGHPLEGTPEEAVVKEGRRRGCGGGSGIGRGAAGQG